MHFEIFANITTLGKFGKFSRNIVFAKKIGEHFRKSQNILQIFQQIPMFNQKGCLEYTFKCKFSRQQKTFVKHFHLSQKFLLK